MLAFVLGAGSSRGALQAGALETLLKAGIKPEMLVGSSIGSINAAFMAQTPTVEATADLQALYKDVDFQDVFIGGGISMLTNLLGGEKKIYQNDGWKELLTSHLEVEHFNELELPCYITGTEINDGTLKVFGDDGEDRVLDAMMASTAILPLYPPYEVNGRLYGDGGLLTTLPIQVAIDRGATTVIALNITTQLMPPEERETIFHTLMHSIDLLLLSQIDLTKTLSHKQNGAKVYCLDLKPKEYVSLQNLENMEELIDRGREQTEAALSEELKPVVEEHASS